MLSKKIIIVNTYTNRCSNCDSNVCLHYQAFNECSQNACVQVCNRYVNDEAVYYSPNSKSIFLLADKALHTYYLHNASWVCSSCPSTCKQQLRIQGIVDNLGYNLAIEDPKELSYPTISTRPIPLALDKDLVSIYNNQLAKGFYLPEQLWPENKFCEYGFAINDEGSLKLENTGIIIYTENDIIELKEHKGM